MKKLSVPMAIAAVVVSAFVPRPHAAAQVASTAPRTAWTTATNYLGIENFQCDCTLSFESATSARHFVFRSEPVVLGVTRRGPSYGLLERGDVITHIDGVSILTADGARRFASVAPGDDVDLTIKRNGRTMKVALEAGETASRMYTPAPVPGYAVEWPAPVATPTPPGAPVTPQVWVGPTPRAAPPAEPSVPSLPPAGVAPAAVAPGVWVGATPAIAAVNEMQRGWYGFSLRWTYDGGCGRSRTTAGSTATCDAPDIPEVTRVDSQGPAGRAGIRSGDRITHVDGVSSTSAEGARRFAEAEPGQKVSLTIRRGSSTLHRDVILGTRPEVRAAIAATRPARPVRPSMRRQLRYTGHIDNVSVEVWSPGGPTVDKIGDTMVITVGTSVVRIKVDPKK